MTRFSLRDMFWLTLVSGMALAWGIDHVWAASRYQRLHDAAWASKCKQLIFGSFGEVLNPRKP